MDGGHRLSRKQRLRLSADKKTRVALLLAILLLLLVLGNTQRERISHFLNKRIFESRNRIELLALCDSLVFRVSRNFNLTDSAYSDSMLAHPSGHVYRRIRQPWPMALPFIFYVERLQEKSVEFGLSCDCIESISKNQLSCVIKSGDIVGALVLVDPDRHARLRGREIAIILNKLGAMSYDNISLILDNDLTFNYFAKPDVYPTERIRKFLESDNIASILEFPANKDRILEFGLSADGQKAKKREKPESAADQDLAGDLFRRHPNVKAFYFDKSNALDSSLVLSIIEYARREEIRYLYRNSSPDVIDSLAYSAGLTIITMDSIADYRDIQSNRLIPLMLKELISPARPNRRIVLLNAANLDAKDLIELGEAFDALGVKLINFIELSQELNLL